MPAKVGGANDCKFSIVLEDDAYEYSEPMYIHHRGIEDVDCRVFVDFRDENDGQHSFHTRLSFYKIMIELPQVLINKKEISIAIGDSYRSDGNIKFKPSQNYILVDINIDGLFFKKKASIKITRMEFIDFIKAFADEYFNQVIKFELYSGDLEDLHKDRFFKSVYKGIDNCAVNSK